MSGSFYFDYKSTCNQTGCYPLHDLNQVTQYGQLGNFGQAGSSLQLPSLPGQSPSYRVDSTFWDSLSHPAQVCGQHNWQQDYMLAQNLVHTGSSQPSATQGAATNRWSRTDYENHSDAAGNPDWDHRVEMGSPLGLTGRDISTLDLKVEPPLSLVKVQRNRHEDKLEEISYKEKASESLSGS